MTDVAFVASMLTDFMNLSIFVTDLNDVTPGRHRVMREDGIR